MKKVIFFLSVCFTLVSCKEISGSFVVTKAFKAQTKNNCGWDPFGQCVPLKEVTIQSGYYNSKINFSSKDLIRIELKANKITETIILKRPLNFEFPLNGSFLLLAKDIHQDFDIKGSVNTTVTNSPNRREYESCTYTVNDYVCYPGGNGHPQCSFQPRQVWGYRLVEYYLKTTAQNLAAFLVHENEDLARFEGQKIDSEKIYLFQGFCR